MFYSSNDVLQILFSEIMQGLLAAAQIVVSVTVLAEYASPKYRGLFLTIKSATFFWGIWVSNAIGTFFHWKNIGLVGITIALYSLTTAFVWPESPYWLASRGRYEECAASHRWLKGCDVESEKELEILVRTQQEYARSSNGKKSFRETVKELFMTIKQRGFYKPVLISNLAGLLSIFCGKLVFTVYAIDIVKGITKSESTAYTAMLILDGITIVSMYIGCALARVLKRRTLFFTSAVCGVLVLYSLSLYLYLIKLTVIDENKYVTICLLMLFSIAVSCGPLILSTSVFAELIPIRSRNFAICIIALSGKFVIGITLKSAPYLFKAFNSHGTFLCFAISSSIAITLLFKYLPETKDKTLQEISDILNGIKRPIHGEEGTLLRKEKS